MQDGWHSPRNSSQVHAMHFSRSAISYAMRSAVRDDCPVIRFVTASKPSANAGHQDCRAHRQPPEGRSVISTIGMGSRGRLFRILHSQRVVRRLGRYFRGGEPVISRRDSLPWTRWLNARFQLRGERFDSRFPPPSFCAMSSCSPDSRVRRRSKVVRGAFRHGRLLIRAQVLVRPVCQVRIRLPGFGVSYAGAIR